MSPAQILCLIRKDIILEYALMNRAYTEGLNHQIMDWEILFIGFDI